MGHARIIPIEKGNATVKTADIGLVFDDRIYSSSWAKFRFLDGIPHELWFGSDHTSLGSITVIGSGDHICYLGFDEKKSIERCLSVYPKAQLSVNQKSATQIIQKIMDIWTGTSDEMICVNVSGTDFQRDVWGALMKIPKGHVVSYGTIAKYIGRPKAVRAVGSAVGANPVSLFIPCHRVVQSSGNIENYGWGDAIKQKILRMECNKSPIVTPE